MLKTSSPQRERRGEDPRSRWEEAASNMGQLLEEVRQGEEFVITRDDAPLARLSPFYIVSV